MTPSAAQTRETVSKRGCAFGRSGFTILGSGMVALILDVPGLVRRVAGRKGRRNARATTYALAE